MIPRSYASEVDAENRSWLLFAREEGDEMVFTALVIQDARNVVVERKINELVLKEHSEELGLEMDVGEFRTLFLKALEHRSSVNLEVKTAEDETISEVFLSLTYKFSPTISRKGILHLSIVATDAPQSLVTLLTSIYTTPPQPTLSEIQQRKKTEKKSIAAAKTGGKTANVSSQEDRGTTSSSQNLDTGTVTVNPMLLKRRHIPTGTMRRKGTRGAKLAKK